jgi:hypothetical protein
MAARMIDRGRGPEVVSTRVTVYWIMDFLREGSSAGRIFSLRAVLFESGQDFTAWERSPRFSASRASKYPDISFGMKFR